MHALITGGEGYIGNYLTKLLLDAGHFVTTLDSRFSNKPYDFSGYPRNKLRRFQGSVNNTDTVARALHHVNVIYHLAARMDYTSSYRQPARLCSTNVEGTTNLLCMADRAGVNKVIFSSSAAVYGNIIPAKETDPKVPVNMYGATKSAAEEICRGFYQKGFEVIILRFFNIWGRKNSNSVINKFVNCHNVIYGDGKQTRDFVFIDDVLLALGYAANWDSGIYNIGTGEETSIEAIWSMLKDEEPEFKNFEPGYNDIFRSCADISYTEQTTGWKAKTLISELDREEIKKLCLLT